MSGDELDLDGPLGSWLDMGVPYTGDVIAPRPLACSLRSPTGAMECILPASEIRHHFEQHLGVDRHGNFRGWPDRRPTR